MLITYAVFSFEGIEGFENEDYTAITGEMKDSGDNFMLPKILMFDITMGFNVPFYLGKDSVWYMNNGRSQFPVRNPDTLQLLTNIYIEMGKRLAKEFHE